MSGVFNFQLLSWKKLSSPTAIILRTASEAYSTLILLEGRSLLGDDIPNTVYPTRSDAFPAPGGNV